jgi:hypothetical protein
MRSAAPAKNVVASRFLLVGSESVSAALYSLVVTSSGTTPKIPVG